jgi:TPP-dependent pyruvate/acetoin dehydrogenase alpha subunit
MIRNNQPQLVNDMDYPAQHASIEPDRDLPGKSTLLEMFRSMLIIRRFEETVNDLFMQGRIPSTLHLYIGQEGVATGVSANLRPDDYVLSTHRPHGHSLAKGVAPREIMAELFGKVTGVCKGKGGSMHVGDIRTGVLPAIAIVGSNAPIAAGVALAKKMQNTDCIVACYFGDGATNEGAWHEAMNAAAIWNLPVLFICENNLYAASTPFHLAFRIQHVAERASAYGMPGLVANGNDVLEVFYTSRDAADRARNGDGPTLIEYLTYRQCGHSRSDPRTYRSREEEEAWKERDPISRFRDNLLERSLVDQDELRQIEQAVEEVLQEAITYAENSPEPGPDDLLKHVYKE